MKLSNLEMTEKSINVQENDKDVQENDMLLAEVHPLSFCACTHFVQRIQITPHRTSGEERASRLCELERDLSSYAVLGYTRTVENLRAL